MPFVVSLASIIKVNIKLWWGLASLLDLDLGKRCFLNTVKHTLISLGGSIVQVDPACCKWGGGLESQRDGHVGMPLLGMSGACPPPQIFKLKGPFPAFWWYFSMLSGQFLSIILPFPVGLVIFKQSLFRAGSLVSSLPQCNCRFTYTSCSKFLCLCCEGGMNSEWLQSCSRSLCSV